MRTVSHSPFDLENNIAYRAWREEKLANYPRDIAGLFVPLGDLNRLTKAEIAALKSRCARANMAIYDAGPAGRDAARVREGLHNLARALNLTHMEDHRSQAEDGIVAIEMTSEGGRAGYIPYSNLPLSWHTDGYYNYGGPSHCVKAMTLHCVRDAAEGGVNRLLDPQIAYIRLRDLNPGYIEALIHSEAMAIPEGEGPHNKPRAKNVGPVFFLDPSTGALLMRYTARKRHVEWRADEMTQQAVCALSEILAHDPLILEYKLRPGEGLVCNNVLHSRTGFVNRPQGGGRLLYRVRYHDRLQC